MRIMLVQYQGDYREAFRSLDEDGVELYYGHRYVLDQLSRIHSQLGETAILCCRSDESYSVALPSGVTVMGGGAGDDWDGPKILDIVQRYDPTHLIVLGPLTKFIKWGLRHNRNVSCIFADSFEISFARRIYRYGFLSLLLNHKAVGWVANHGIAASKSLARIGVKKSKIIPWDWIYDRQPDDVQAKSWVASKQRTLFYAGAIIERKGIGDILHAVKILADQGVNVDVQLAGAGEIGRFKTLANDLKIGENISFLGRVPNTEVSVRMRQADAVLVPSQHGYPEGLPLTIYEALCVRTPLVISDHPMFVDRLTDGVTAMIYRSQRPDELASCIRRIIEEPELHNMLSANAQEAWLRLQISAKWGDVLFRMLRYDSEDLDWLKRHSLDNA